LDYIISEENNFSLRSQALPLIHRVRTLRSSLCTFSDLWSELGSGLPYPLWGLRLPWVHLVIHLPVSRQGCMGLQRDAPPL